MWHSNSYIISALFTQGALYRLWDCHYHSLRVTAVFYYHGGISECGKSIAHLLVRLSERRIYFLWTPARSLICYLTDQSQGAESLSQRGQPNTWPDKLWKAGDQGVLTEEYCTRTINSFPALLCILTRPQYPGYSSTGRNISTWGYCRLTCVGVKCRR